MARHEEEGSGNFRDESDDEEYSNIGGSGDGSGEGMFRFQSNHFYEYVGAFSFNLLTQNITLNFPGPIDQQTPKVRSDDAKEPVGTGTASQLGISVSLTLLVSLPICLFLQRL